MHRIIAAVFCLALAVPAAALAQDHRDTPPDRVIDFVDDLVQGGRYVPEGESIHVRRGALRGSLVRARAHFIPELLESLERM